MLHSESDTVMKGELGRDSDRVLKGEHGCDVVDLNCFHFAVSGGGIISAFRFPSRLLEAIVSKLHETDDWQDIIEAHTSNP